MKFDEHVSAADAARPEEPQVAPTSLALYHSDMCGFCWRVRQTIAELGLAIELRDVVNGPGRRAELAAGGGSSQVPCLRIEYPDGRVEWMYESADITRFLTERYGRTAGPR